MLEKVKTVHSTVTNNHPYLVKLLVFIAILSASIFVLDRPEALRVVAIAAFEHFIFGGGAE